MLKKKALNRAPKTRTLVENAPQRLLWNSRQEIREPVAREITDAAFEYGRQPGKSLIEGVKDMDLCTRREEMFDVNSKDISRAS